VADYVICASCGARMKADRRWCLKCDEPLVGLPHFDDASLRRDRLLVAATVVSLFVVLAIALVWESRQPQLDEAARPAAGALQTQAASASVSAAAPTAARSDLDAFVPVTSLEASRSGAASFAGGDFDQARRRYEEALARQPDDPEALNSLGQALIRLHRPDEAIERFTRAVQLAPQKWAYHFNLAHALAEQGKWEPAIAEYRTAAGLFPTDYATQYNLAMALHKKGDEAGAVLEFQKAIALAPSEATFHLSLAISLEKLGRVGEARQEYARYLEMNPETPEAARLKTHIEDLSREHDGRDL
jgi:Flp pilus assembly protein TadD